MLNCPLIWISVHCWKQIQEKHVHLIGMQSCKNQYMHASYSFEHKHSFDQYVFKSDVISEVNLPRLTSIGRLEVGRTSIPVVHTSVLEFPLKFWKVALLCEVCTCCETCNWSEALAVGVIFQPANGYLPNHYSLICNNGHLLGCNWKQAWLFLEHSLVICFKYSFELAATAFFNVVSSFGQ